MSSAPEDKATTAAAPGGGKEKKKSKESKRNSEAKLEVKESPEVVEAEDKKPSEGEVRLIEDTEKTAPVESKESNGKSEPKRSKSNKKSSVPNDNNIDEAAVSFAEMIQRNFLKELMSKAEKRSAEFKLNLVSQLNEVFRLFDIDRDGVIGEMDLKYTFSSLGETNVPDDKIKSMLSECPQPIDFNAFVGMFESKDMEFDSEFDLIKAFAKWDSQNNGFILEEKIKNDLMRKGDRFSEKDADRALEEAPIYDEEGDPAIDYVEFCTNLCGFQNLRNSELFQERCSRSSFKK